jgi:hypothetical protein
MEGLLILGFIIGVPVLIYYFCHTDSAGSSTRVNGQSTNAARSQNQRQAAITHPQSKSHTKYNLPPSR